MGQKGLMFLEGDGSKCLNQNFQLHRSLGGGGGIQLLDSLNWEVKTIEKLELLMFLKYAQCLEICSTRG